MTHLDRAIYFTLAAYHGTRPVLPQDIHWMDGGRARFVDAREAAHRLEQLADDGDVIRDERGYWPKVAHGVEELMR